MPSQPPHRPTCSRRLTKSRKHWVCLEHAQISVERPLAAFRKDVNRRYLVLRPLGLARVKSSVWFEGSDLLTPADEANVRKNSVRPETPKGIA